MWPLVPRPALDGAEGDRETGVLLSGFANSLRKDAFILFCVDYIQCWELKDVKEIEDYRQHTSTMTSMIGLGMQGNSLFDFQL